MERPPDALKEMLVAGDFQSPHPPPPQPGNHKTAIPKTSVCGGLLFEFVQLHLLDNVSGALMVSLLATAFTSWHRLVIDGSVYTATEELEAMSLSLRPPGKLVLMMVLKFRERPRRGFLRILRWLVLYHSIVD